MTCCGKLMRPPWHLLKQAEMAALSERRREGMRPATIARLRKLVQRCERDAEADQAICLHGSMALLCEYDGDWSDAVKHRKIEISKIRRLHKLEESHPTGGYALQDYREEDMELRRAILSELKNRSEAGGEMSGHAGPVPPILSFESERLRSITQAFARRGKAIRYHGKLECSRAVNGNGERLNVDFDGRAALQLRLSIWEDEIYVLGIVLPAKGRYAGWAVCDQYHGNFAGITEREISDRFVRTLHSPDEVMKWWPEAILTTSGAP